MMDEMKKYDLMHVMCDGYPCGRICDQYCGMYDYADKAINNGYRKVCEPVIKNGEVIGFVNGADYVPKNLFLFGLSNTRKSTVEKINHKIHQLFNRDIKDSTVYSQEEKDLFKEFIDEIDAICKQTLEEDK